MVGKVQRAGFSQQNSIWDTEPYQVSENLVKLNSTIESFSEPLFLAHIKHHHNTETIANICWPLALH